MQNQITEALKAKNYYALAMQAAVQMSQGKGEGVLSALQVQSVATDSDYLDLLQYASSSALKEEPKIGLYRHALLIEKGYEKVGNFFKARLAEYRHIFKTVEIQNFGQNNLARARDQQAKITPEICIQIMQDQAAFIFFHGMMRPLYQEMAVLEHLRKNKPEAKYLDYGSDNGDLAILASMYKYDVTIAQAEGRLLDAVEKRLKLRQLKAKTLPLSAGAALPELPMYGYDIIALHNMLANTNEPFALIEECRAGLKHDGLLFVGRYPFNHKLGGIIADSAARQQSIIDYLEKHFTRLGNSGLFRKI